jgi:hypothetical protein
VAPGVTLRRMCVLAQATNASAKTEFSDIALGAFVFLLAFGYGVFASGGSGS